MTDDFGSPLKRSLDAIDSARRRAYLTFITIWVATFAALLWFTHVLRTGDNLERALSAAVVALGFAIFLAAAAVMLYVTRMTKSVLRAIDIATTPPPPADTPPPPT